MNAVDVRARKATRRVLLVFSDQDGDLADLIHKYLGGRENITVDRENNEEKALSRLEDSRYHLIVIGLRLAANSRETVGDHGGMQLATHIKTWLPAARIAIVTPAFSNVIQRRCLELPAPPAAQFSVSSPDLASTILEHAENFTEPRRRLDVAITASDGNEWDYELRGEGFDYLKPGHLTLGTALIEGWRLTGSLIPHGSDHWMESFSGLGKNIITGLCEGNKEFRKEVQAGLDEAGGLANTRVSFNVSQHHYELALEAVCSPLNELPEPWAVHAPLLRTVLGGEGGASARLFEGRPRPLRALIVCADTDGSSNVLDDNGLSIRLGKLHNLDAECKRLQKLLERTKTVRFGEVRGMGYGGDPPVTLRRFHDALKEQPPWDVVHFAGHAYFRRDSGELGQGFLFVGSPGEPEAVEIKAVIPYLRKARLLYRAVVKAPTRPSLSLRSRPGFPRWSASDGRYGMSPPHSMLASSIGSSWRSGRSIRPSSVLDALSTGGTPMTTRGRPRC